MFGIPEHPKVRIYGLFDNNPYNAPFPASFMITYKNIDKSHRAFKSAPKSSDLGSCDLWI